MADESWIRYSEYVLKGLERNQKDHKELVDAINVNREAIVELKLQSKATQVLWGFLGGLLPLILTVIFFVLTYIK
jgi:hypothetical protein